MGVTTRSTSPPGAWGIPSDSGTRGRTRQTGTHCRSLCRERGVCKRLGVRGSLGMDGEYDGIAIGQL